MVKYYDIDENPSNIEIYDFLKSKNVENLDSFDIFKMDENALKKQSKKEEKQHISQQISSLTQKHEKSAFLLEKHCLCVQHMLLELFS
jgi:hypothetical protein